MTSPTNLNSNSQNSQPGAASHHRTVSVQNAVIEENNEVRHQAVNNSNGNHHDHNHKPHSKTGTLSTGFVAWLSQKIRTAFYLIYGSLVMAVKLKPFKEMLSSNRKYIPENEPTPGQIAVITGGPRGIAYELAKKLLQMDFFVIMGARDVASSQLKIDRIRAEGVTKGRIQLVPLNLKSLNDTKMFAMKVLELTPRIDYLFNNAGIMMTPHEVTEDGYESQFQVNYFSHFYLTRLLLPTIRKTAEGKKDGNCRIINTTSVYQHAGSLDFSNLANREHYASAKCYFDSKLCQVIFTKELEKRLQLEKAENVHAFAVHPGIVPSSELWTNAGGYHYVVSQFFKPIMPTPADGADALIHAALSSSLEDKGGSYLEGLSIAEPTTEAKNPQIQQDLWGFSANLLTKKLRKFENGKLAPFYDPTQQ